MKRILLFSVCAIMVAMLVFLQVTPNFAAQKKTEFTVMWSIYVGWMPWPYADESGILKKWADKYGIEIKLLMADYIPSIEAYVAGQADACVMTNMEALDMPASSGIDTTALIIGDFSNGNDALLTRNNLQFKNLKGKDIYLVELSVSHYLLARGLEMNEMKESDIRIVNTSDSDIGPVFISQKSLDAVVTWNPIVISIEQTPGVTRVFDSSKVPGEIIDMMVVRTDVLKKHPELGKALTGAWYEAMNLMSGRGPRTKEMLAGMAELAGSSEAEFRQQLKTTAMFYKPNDAVEFTNGQKLIETMEFVRTFCFDHGLLGTDAKSKDDVGIQFPDGKILGDKENVKLRFTTEYMDLAAQGKL